MIVPTVIAQTPVCDHRGLNNEVVGKRARMLTRQITAGSARLIRWCQKSYREGRRKQQPAGERKVHNRIAQASIRNAKSISYHRIACFVVQSAQQAFCMLNDPKPRAQS
jgi:hypothetical protein